MERRFIAYFITLALGVYACTPTSRTLESSAGSKADPTPIPNNTGLGASNFLVVGPTPTPTLTQTPVILPAYSIYKNGVTGTWFTSSLITEFSTGGSLNDIAAFDNINGDSTGKQIAVPCNPAVPGCSFFGNTAWMKFVTCPSGAPVATCAGATSTAFYTAHGGKLEFDLRIDIPLTEVNNVTVYFGQDAMCTYHHVLLRSDLSNGSFTHLTLPMNTAFITSCPIPNLHDMPFYLVLIRNTPNFAQGAVFTINDVRWNQ